MTDTPNPAALSDLQCAELSRLARAVVAGEVEPGRLFHYVESFAAMRAREAENALEGRIREALEKATPGPWRQSQNRVYVGPVGQGDLVMVCDGCANADLIVAARNALPTLLAALSSLRADNERLRSRVDELEEDVRQEVSALRMAGRDQSHLSPDDAGLIDVLSAVEGHPVCEVMKRAAVKLDKRCRTIASLHAELAQARTKLAVLASHISCAQSEDGAEEVLCNGCVAACNDAILYLGGDDAVRKLAPPIRLNDHTVTL